jgi:hypothetical protein
MLDAAISGLVIAGWGADLGDRGEPRAAIDLDGFSPV